MKKLFSSLKNSFSLSGARKGASLGAPPPAPLRPADMPPPPPPPTANLAVAKTEEAARIEQERKDREEAERRELESGSGAESPKLVARAREVQSLIDISDTKVKSDLPKERTPEEQSVADGSKSLADMSLAELKEKSVASASPPPFGGARVKKEEPEVAPESAPAELPTPTERPLAGATEQEVAAAIGNIGPAESSAPETAEPPVFSESGKPEVSEEAVEIPQEDILTPPEAADVKTRTDVATEQELKGDENLPVVEAEVVPAPSKEEELAAAVGEMKKEEVDKHPSPDDVSPERRALHMEIAKNEKDLEGGSIDKEEYERRMAEWRARSDEVTVKDVSSQIKEKYDRMAELEKEGAKLEDAVDSPEHQKRHKEYTELDKELFHLKRELEKAGGDFNSATRSPESPTETPGPPTPPSGESAAPGARSSVTDEQRRQLETLVSGISPERLEERLKVLDGQEHRTDYEKQEYVMMRDRLEREKFGAKDESRSEEQLGENQGVTAEPPPPPGPEQPTEEKEPTTEAAPTDIEIEKGEQIIRDDEGRVIERIDIKTGKTSSGGRRESKETGRGESRDSSRPWASRWEKFKTFIQEDFEQTKRDFLGAFDGRIGAWNNERLREKYRGPMLRAKETLDDRREALREAEEKAELHSTGWLRFMGGYYKSKADKARGKVQDSEREMRDYLGLMNSYAEKRNVHLRIMEREQRNAMRPFEKIVAEETQRLERLQRANTAMASARDGAIETLSEIEVEGRSRGLFKGKEWRTRAQGAREVLRDIEIQLRDNEREIARRNAALVEADSQADVYRVQIRNLADRAKDTDILDLDIPESKDATMPGPEVMSGRPVSPEDEPDAPEDEDDENDEQERGPEKFPADLFTAWWNEIYSDDLEVKNDAFLDKLKERTGKDDVAEATEDELWSVIRDVLNDNDIQFSRGEWKQRRTVLQGFIKKREMPATS